jgi:aspartokinase
MEEPIMERTVLELDRIALDGAKSAVAIKYAIASLDDLLVVVIPAFEGATKLLAAAVRIAERGDSPEGPLAFLREGHLAIAGAMDAPLFALEAASLRIEILVRRLRVLLAVDGPREFAEIFAAGSRLSATCVALAFAALGRPAALLEPKEIGLFASEGPRGTRVDLDGPRARASLGRFPASILPGGFGVDEGGRAVLLGGPGAASAPFSVAAEIAAALGADLLDSAAFAAWRQSPFVGEASRFARGRSACVGRAGGARSVFARAPTSA